MSTDELVAFAVEALDGLAHVRIDFEEIDSTSTHRNELKARGWQETQLVWMLHGGPLPRVSAAPAVEPVDYDEVHELRLIGYREDFGEVAPRGFHEQAREVALALGAEVLAVRKGGRPLGFAQIEHIDSSVEVTQVFVHPDHRGAGNGTALTRAAMAASGGSGCDCWIVTDVDGRPRDLYTRLGFRAVARTASLTRLPQER